MLLIHQNSVGVALWWAGQKHYFIDGITVLLFHTTVSLKWSLFVWLSVSFSPWQLFPVSPCFQSGNLANCIGSMKTHECSWHLWQQTGRWDTQWSRKAALWLRNIPIIFWWIISVLYSFRVSIKLNNFGYYILKLFISFSLSNTLKVFCFVYYLQFI